jgi:hypothetical protein
MEPRPTPRSHADPRLSNGERRSSPGYRVFVATVILASAVWLAAIGLWFRAHTCGMGVAC